jgi:dihydroceramidase
MVGIGLCIRHGFSKRFYICFGLMGLVGFGSFAFHATLLYEMQLLDELPMIYGAAVFVFISYDIFHCRRTLTTTKSIDHETTPPDSLESFHTADPLCLTPEPNSPSFIPYDYLFPVPHVGLLLIFSSISVTLVYLYNCNPIFHQVIFGILIVSAYSLTYLNIYQLSHHESLEYILEKMKLRAKLLLAFQDTVPQDEIDVLSVFIQSKGYLKKWLAYQKNKVSVCLVMAFISYVLGFLMWNFDNLFCPWLLSTRERLGWPLDTLLQFHSWWHLLTALGTYCCMISGCALKQLYSGRLFDFYYILGVFPILIPLKPHVSAKQNLL